MDPIYERIFKQPESVTPAELEPLGEHTLCYSALLHAARHDVLQARRVLQQIGQEQPGHACPLLPEVQALVYYGRREYLAAGDAAAAALKQNPDALFAPSVLAGVAIASRKYPQALAYYQKVLEADPESDRLLLHIAQVHALSRNRAEAWRYVRLAKPSLRKTLYRVFLPFLMYRRVTLLWIVLIFAAFSVPYLFPAFYLLTTPVLVYLYRKFGSQRADLVITRTIAYILFVQTFFFALAACALLDQFFGYAGWRQ